MPFLQRKLLAAAYDWQRETEAQLKARIYIEETILKSMRTELADLRKLQGSELAARFGCETPAAVAKTMSSKEEWTDLVGEIFMHAILEGKW